MNMDRGNGFRFSERLKGASLPVSDAGTDEVNDHFVPLLRILPKYANSPHTQSDVVHRRKLGRRQGVL